MEKSIISPERKAKGTIAHLEEILANETFKMGHSEEFLKGRDLGIQLALIAIKIWFKEEVEEVEPVKLKEAA